jgi:hypothetical protein
VDEFQYFLKREYGHPATYIHVTDSVVNTATGTQAATEYSYSITRVIYLPVDIAKKILAAARTQAYPYGDAYDLSSSQILIDKNDLPDGFLANNNDRIILEDTQQVFKVLQITDLHHHEIHCIEFMVEELQQMERAVV